VVNIRNSSPAQSSLVTDNCSRLLRLLESNIAQAREPLLVERLRSALRIIEQNSRGIATGRAKEVGARPGADHVTA
jgi:hypothetical protein